jgi:hypothetical protein
VRARATVAESEGSVVQGLLEREWWRCVWPAGEVVVERHLVYYQTGWQLLVGEDDG